MAYRPSHADATYDFKYGVRAVQVRGRLKAVDVGALEWHGDKDTNLHDSRRISRGA